MKLSLNLFIILTFCLILIGCQTFSEEEKTSELTITTSLPVITSLVNELFYNTNVSIKSISKNKVHPAYYLEYPYNIHNKLNTDILLLSGDSDKWLLDLVNRDKFSDILVLKSFSSPIYGNYNNWFDLNAILSYSNSILNIVKFEHNEFYLENKDQLNKNHEKLKSEINQILDENNDLFYSNIISTEPSFVYLYRNFRINNHGVFFNNIDRSIKVKQIEEFIEIINSQEISCLINDDYHNDYLFEIIKNELTQKNQSLNFVSLNLQPSPDNNYTLFIKEQVNHLKNCIN